MTSLLIPSSLYLYVRNSAQCQGLKEQKLHSFCPQGNYSLVEIPKQVMTENDTEKHVSRVTEKGIKQAKRKSP